MLFSLKVPVTFLILALGREFRHMAVQRQQPREFAERELMVLDFHGTDPAADKATLALTRYDVSLAGFANRTGHWYAFPGYEDQIPVASTLLPFGNSYRDLIGGLANVPSLPLDHPDWQHAVNVLSSHDPATADNVGIEKLKRALATLTVTTCEGTRLKPVSESMSKEKMVAPELLPYIEHRDTICYEIIRAEENGGVWEGPFTELLKEVANIHTLDEALDIVHARVNRTMEELLQAHFQSA